MLFKRKKKKKRPIFGFPCSPSISYTVRSIAASIGTPIYCLSEHLLQTGLSVVMTQLADKQAGEQLVDHLIESHLLADTVDEENEYDQEAAAEARTKQLARQERERVIRLLVNEVENEGMPPGLITHAVKLLIQTAQRRRGPQNS